MRNLLILATLLTACNTAPDKNREEANVIESAKQIIPVAPPPGNPNIDDQLNAQDTLFEDGSVPTSWANAGFDDPAGFKRFLLDFKGWVKEDKIDSIAAHVRFPLKNHKTPEAFKRAYPEIFDVNLKTAVDTQRVDRIFRNQQGAMLGNGQIWFSVVNGKYKIIAINK
ncbi:hypothetical protein [Chitinophaga cymbidii]|uniref:Uncharacterized protein n=1 Tax=Chitinophaga cymbidii TaxID=1096750 RepID=A0A512REK6_9BACT|nr:hypothetical protein [Chitinophaga cymbidii]GEP94064.1 hypothetical protein CCY01nite_03240 [Chitinophaga cymbidii]